MKRLSSEHSWGICVGADFSVLHSGVVPSLSLQIPISTWWIVYQTWSIHTFNADCFNLSLVLRNHRSKILWPAAHFHGSLPRYKIPCLQLLPQCHFPLFHNVFVPTTNYCYCQSLSHARLDTIPWTATLQAPLSSAVSRSLLKSMSIESVVNFYRY